ncbi:hypothetical protein JW964_04350, partial [candidate division KSB1 bacterium]|nr:hypothetical protein [candidate division KSB1 bacterium]
TALPISSTPFASFTSFRKVKKNLCVMISPKGEREYVLSLWEEGWGEGHKRGLTIIAKKVYGSEKKIVTLSRKN